MEIIKVTPRGYCKGVTRAIRLAKETAQQYPDKDIYILGMLVHNQFVMQALKELNIHTIDDKSKTRMELLDLIPSGSVVIFTAHGVSPDVKKKATERGFISIDASCPDVVKTQELVIEMLDKNYEILYIGKEHHPEAEAITSLSNHVHLITKVTDVDLLSLSSKLIFVTNQTTMSIFDIDTIFKHIKELYPSAMFSEEICNATRIRQQAIANLDTRQVDVLYVVGDKHSNNSNRLAQIAKEKGIQKVYLIDDVLDISNDQLKDAKCVAVTSGASTPTYLTNLVIEYLSEYSPNKEKPIIDIHKILI